MSRFLRVLQIVEVIELQDAGFCSWESSFGCKRVGSGYIDVYKYWYASFKESTIFVSKILDFQRNMIAEWISEFPIMFPGYQ